MSFPGEYIPEFGDAVSYGLVPRYTRASGLGYNPDVDTATTPEDAWGNSGPYPWLSGLTSLEILSVGALAANDTAAGTGARTVTVTALDANYNIVSLVMTLNGVTPVALPSQVLRINAIRVTTAGSGNTNAADIILRDAGGGTTRGIILTGVGTSRQAPYTVPAGFTLAIRQILLVVDSPAGSVGQFATIATYFKSPTGAAIMPLVLGNTSGQPYSHFSDPPIMANEKTDFSLIITKATDNNTIVTAGWNGILRAN